ncbi:MAG: tetratricopeptide repeat protein [Acidobacteriota bacterium]
MPLKRSLLDWLGWIALLALVVPLAGRPLSHDDLFWHLQSGAWMAEHGSVPHVDPFSFTRQGAPWVTHEWGFSLLVYGIWLAGGYLALIATRILLILLIGWVLVRTMRLEGSSEDPSRYLYAGLLAVGLWTVSAEVILRAALLSELFLALTLLLLARYRKTGRTRELVCVAGLFWVWANVHSGVVFGLFVLGLFTLEALIRRQGRPYLLTLAASVVLSLVNPSGIEALLYPFRLSRILFASDIPWELGHFAASSPAANSGLLILAVLLLAGLLPLRRVPVRAAELVAIATFVVLLYRSPRFVFHAVILALPVLYRLWSERKRSNLSSLAAGAVAGLTLVSALVAWTGFEARLLAPGVPEPAARFVEKAGIRGRMFNHQNYGGYLLWRLKTPVFWDGRNDVFAPLVKEYVSTPFPELMDRYRVDWALITEHEWTPDLQGDWGLVYWDDFRAVYLRRIPRFEPLLAKLELQVVPPFGGWPGMEGADPVQARAELDRVLAADPESQRALYFRALLSVRQGRIEEARRDLETALAIRPNEQVSRLLEALPK